MHIQSIPMCKLNFLQKSDDPELIYIGEGTGNNYAYLITDDATKEATVVDPANPSEYDRDKAYFDAA